MLPGYPYAGEMGLRALSMDELQEFKSAVLKAQDGRYDPLRRLLNAYIFRLERGGIIPWPELFPHEFADRSGEVVPIDHFNDLLGEINYSRFAVGVRYIELLLPPLSKLPQPMLCYQLGVLPPHVRGSDTDPLSKKEILVQRASV